MDMTNVFQSPVLHSCSRPVGTSRCSQGGEPEVKVREPGPRSVHREPHVGLQRFSDH